MLVQSFMHTKASPVLMAWETGAPKAQACAYTARGTLAIQGTSGANAVLTRFPQTHMA